MEKRYDIARLAPFMCYVLVMFAVPAALIVISAFRTGSGDWSLQYFTVLQRPGVMRSLLNSIWLSALTSLIGATGGALVCHAITGCRENGRIQRIVEAASSTLSQFGGVMLAFACMATLGNQGLMTLWIQSVFHLDIYEHGMWLYTPAGLIIPYTLFQLPLMIISFYPAMAGMPPHLAEAVATLGGSRWNYWTRIAMPLLAPSFMSSFLLLFANAFAAYATAAALISQGAQIIPLQIRAALIGETGMGSASEAGALAVTMLIVMGGVVCLHACIERKATTWRK
ncbi:ABC transporter permease [Bifidobacterium pseudolongum subsp. globosum]|uniref:ABC transporter permease n=1 Tax=Bifidobacterium pseudolongum subsp. globosum TaxID=1690 RepID=A0A2N3QYT2_9BIFI|nr:ABC transporter permease subunit [Bifidobacterium pseudolongum]PKU90196.1 ABC transporter permease [Bifidobacterium pseudolongum subsp. globosum]PKU98160.1 ABC transporter permease [Bifidobacterium pseudolongum subsp. globosum]PKU98350.1 ABC transporter permease [Bifidobacterium pseudolongum subsp. globosum]PKV06475.1 ABC transporter permease [Bifidobacterium pseudolongum subsp. globosum]RYQ76241.1 ABC transporter permease [Bifidobacterium pseudolongum subsp. globosum]